VGSERFEVEKHLEEGGARVRGTRFVLVVAVTAMLMLAAGSASGQQDERFLPPKLDEDTTPEEGGEKNLDAEAQELTKEEASAPKAVGETPTKEDVEKSGEPPEPPIVPPTPSVASEGVPVSGNPTSGYETPEGTRVPVGAVSSGGLARLPATGG
jgi:hypothetical protein